MSRDLRELETSVVFSFIMTWGESKNDVIIATRDVIIATRDVIIVTRDVMTTPHDVLKNHTYV